MRKTALMLGAAAVLAACGSGGSGDEIAAGTCRKAPIPSTGPGDASHYFPAEVGFAWTYQSAWGTTAVSVTGTQVVGAETASVFTTTSALDPTPTRELVVVRPGGVVVLADAGADPLLQQLQPELVLPFPVAVGPRTELIRCVSLDVGDLDGDGRSDHADIVEYLTVLSTSDTAGVPAGDFVGVANVRRDGQVTVRASSGPSVTADFGMQDWYAPGVGRVVTLLTFSVPGTSQTETLSLTSWTPPPAAAAHAMRAASPRPARGQGSPESLEAAALGLARRVAGAGR
jgi:hypothetical protein